MPLTEDPQWRTVHNMIRLELHQLAFADFSWQGRNTHFFNRLFLVLAGEGRCGTTPAANGSCCVPDSACSCRRGWISGLSSGRDCGF
ncbi:MAG: hypothetical protein L6W00_10860 [Lentisphaeria bacterium]|nr:MAG: hypothetical protein L6W00_10860 [Lentisphaeria bacterium]